MPITGDLLTNALAALAFIPCAISSTAPKPTSQPQARRREVVVNGKRIKTIGARARAELGAMLDRKVHLFLFVKVRDNWLDDPERYRAIGVDFNV